jgi:MFS transporter, Spinster family, sphingosine-1-phosphate transporter
MRATAFALNIVVIRLLGDAISPPIVGAIAGFATRISGAPIGLTCWFGATLPLLVPGGILWLWGVRYLQRDTAAAPYRLR